MRVLFCALFLLTPFLSQSQDSQGTILTKDIFQAEDTPTAREVQQSMIAIHDLLKIFTFDKLHHCDASSKTWVQSALTQETVTKAYHFNDHCDVSGSFRASFVDEFPVLFNLRNLQDFTRSKMMVKMRINQRASGIHYQFEVSEGMVTNGSKTVGFNVEYEVEIDPLSGQAKYDSQKGKMTLTKLNNLNVLIARPLNFH
jgi:hypothetical protein